MIFNARRFKRPVLIFGWGVHLAGAARQAVELAERSNIPAALTWGAIDLFPDDHPLRIGGFGTHGARAPNFSVQNADFILAVGTRLDSKSTGTPVDSFARAAYIVMVDIDAKEIARHSERVEGCVMDAAEFLKGAIIEAPDTTAWLARIAQWKMDYPLSDEPAYQAVRALSQSLVKGDIIVSDTGHALAWMMQAFAFKKGQRFIHAFNNTPMGYGLPAAIGASFANPGRRIVLVTGDGGLQVNVQELATVAKHKLPIHIILFNNHGHGMCRQTQDQWLEGHHYSTSPDGGLPDPDFKAVARAYGIRVLPDGTYPGATFGTNTDEHTGPTFMQVEIPFDAKLATQVRFGRANEDADPLLPREELRSQMMIPLYGDSDG